MSWCVWCADYEGFNTKLHGRGLCGNTVTTDPNSSLNIRIKEIESELKIKNEIIERLLKKE